MLKKFGILLFKNFSRLKKTVLSWRYSSKSIFKIFKSLFNYFRITKVAICSNVAIETMIHLSFVLIFQSKLSEFWEGVLVTSNRGTTSRGLRFGELYEKGRIILPVLRIGFDKHSGCDIPLNFGLVFQKWISIITSKTKMSAEIYLC